MKTTKNFNQKSYAQKPALSVNSPLISVIIPVYNVESTLERCLDSVLSQTYQNLEILLIDDGSTDRSGELCNQFTKKDSRIKVIHQKNQGLSVARNTGLDAMHGAYVTFVDSDDFLDTTMIKQLYDALFPQFPGCEPLKLSICPFAEVFPDDSERSFVKTPSAQSQVLQISQNQQNPQTLKISEQPLRLLDQPTCLIDMLCEHDFTLMACGKLYAAELFTKVRYPVGKLYEDVGTTYKLILQCQEIAFLPAPLYKYYQNPDSIIHQTFRPQKLDLIALTDQMCDDIASFYNLSSPSENHKITTNGERNPTSQSEKSKKTTYWKITAPESLQPSQKTQESLENALKLRRMHARFSVLRQLVLTKPKTSKEKAEFQKTRQEIVTYLKSHRNDVLKNPLSTPRDLFALQTLRLGLPVFTLAWRLYSRFR